MKRIKIDIVITLFTRILSGETKAVVLEVPENSIIGMDLTMREYTLVRAVNGEIIKRHTGRELNVKITDCLCNGVLGLQTGFCLVSFKKS